MTLFRSVSRLLVAAFFFGTLGYHLPAMAFHEGTIGDCEGCHDRSQSNTNIYYLAGMDQSSTCLRCHQRKGDSPPGDHYVSTPGADMPTGVPPGELTPGGDFGWLKKGYEDGDGAMHGHNVIAAAYGYSADFKGVSPGGEYPSASLHCSSCHDPHGRYGRNADGSIGAKGAPIKASGSYDISPDPDDTAAVGVYRLLGGKGYQPVSLIGDFAFAADPPAAVAPSSYNGSEDDHQIRVAYGSGMSEWCANCHGNMRGTKMTHPAGTKLGAKIAGNYNSYVKTGDSSGTEATSYLSLVPFEAGTADYGKLKRLTRSESGPDANANISCLSCHRAHASGWSYMLRFDVNTRFMTVSDRGIAAYPDPVQYPDLAKGRSQEEIRRAYYGRPAGRFAPFQRPLCAKCHVKD